MSDGSCGDVRPEEVLQSELSKADPNRESHHSEVLSAGSQHDSARRHVTVIPWPVPPTRSLSSGQPAYVRLTSSMSHMPSATVVWTDTSFSSPEPPQDAARPLSVGSQLHSSGACRPCAYVASAEGCRSGAQCRYCHHRHTRKDQRRPCKMKRTRCKELLEVFDQVLGPERCQQLDLSHTLEADYMRSILKGRAHLHEV
uniref:C3H1-type domain-containing protein n=1 Tax=Noctiluca scintillans TaxID=2966 RepID=A0A7S1EY39_NOCSC|mmetsp:Transcript_16183/g.43981  ORF Transcript_16183/g.43981 Transcript_16183/m.43981 type:complete len:199 (+) Transcript_16183:69-665(+)